MPRSALVLTTLVACLAGGALLWHFGTGGDEVDFNTDIRPILNEKCVTCHGGVRREAELSLLFREDAMRPAESGERAVVPGRPGRSELIRRVTLSDPDERMPLEHPPLTDEEVGLLKTWIDQGAEWAPHWAYVAPDDPTLPKVSEPNWPQNGIDRFVMARLDREELAPASRADCAVLLRRVSLDLTGLPPTPSESDAFCADPSQANYEKAVDSLLASPRFGEHWAAYWLDLARYADTNGYEKDTPRTIWKYRDWVIRAFNSDMPFDEFSTEQLAGDLMENVTEGRLVATAFSRNSMTNTEGGTDDEEFRTAAVIDRLNTTFEVWQATTIGCVQCHGHPYDPFRHEEFYELLAFFNNTADTDQPNNEPKLYQFEEAERFRGRVLVAERDSLERDLLEKVDDDSLAAWTQRLERYARDGNRPPRFEGRTVVPHIVRIAKKQPPQRSPFERHLLRELFVSTRPEFDAQREELARIREAIAELEPVTTPVMRELPPSQSRWTHVFERGNWMVHGDRVEADVPESLPAMPEGVPKNRLGLARWMFSGQNPLTARVAVNRFWEQLFGTGLVETVEDFGTQGENPSHPALLDWLALRFSDGFDWSVKALLKEIVTSATYQQSSRVTPELLDLDPNNRLLARGPRFRLSAEQVRDQALAVSGLLSGEMFGPSVYPPQPPGLWNNPYSSLTWEASEGDDRYRRALYTYWRRTVPHPAMLAFDAPSRELCVSRRIRTNTPIQSLVTLNDPAFVEAAVALARRLDPSGDVKEQLRHGYRLALQREPSPETLESLESLYDRARSRYESDPTQAAALLNIKANAFAEYDEEDGARLDVSGADLPDTPKTAALAVAANAMLNLDAFLTKE